MFECMRVIKYKNIMILRVYLAVCCLVVNICLFSNNLNNLYYKLAKCLKRDNCNYSLMHECGQTGDITTRGEEATNFPSIERFSKKYETGVPHIYCFPWLIEGGRGDSIFRHHSLMKNNYVSQIQLCFSKSFCYK